jgi:hypothetical protein
MIAVILDEFRPPFPDVRPAAGIVPCTDNAAVPEKQRAILPLVAERRRPMCRDPEPQAIDRRKSPVHEDLPSRVGNSEPSRSVDFGKVLLASGTRRPFHLESVAADECGIPFAFDGPRMYDFAPRLPRLPEWQENSLRVVSSFLGEFAPSGGQRRFIGANQAFRDAPSSVILVFPKWSAWMTEQDFEICGASSKQEEPGALRFPRSHRGC